MLSKSKINTIKKRQQDICFIKFEQTGGISFNFKRNEKLYNEDGIFVRHDQSYYTYKPSLYLTRYHILVKEAKGILYRDGNVLAYISDDIGESEFECVENCHDDIDGAVNAFLEFNYDYVIRVKNNIYVASSFFECNTKEQIKEFIDTLTKNGEEVVLLTGEL